MEKIKLSICIPTYEMRGEAKRVLTRSFDILKKQTFKDFEVVVSDNSEDDIIKNLCKNSEYQLLNINYFKNPRKGIAQNTNEAIKNAKGEIIKILYMDDYLANGNPLLFDENMTWLLDCDYYKRMHDKYGEPNILNEVNVIIGISEHQVTNILSNFVKKKEYLYMLKKYKKELFYWLKLW